MSYPLEPGVCNINPGGVQKRINHGVKGTVIAIITGYLLLGEDNLWFYGLIFPPVLFSVVCFVQAFAKYCIAIGLRTTWIQYMGKSGSAQPISWFKDRDWVKSQKIIATSLLISLVIAGMFVLLSKECQY